MVPTIPAIMNAIYDAIGVRIIDAAGDAGKGPDGDPRKAAARKPDGGPGRRVSECAMSAVEGVAKPGVREMPFAADLADIRRLARLMPGALPVAVNGIRVAASVRPHRFVIEGGDDRPVTMPRTAFQVVYPDGTVMIDAGLDRETHDSFSTPDKREPYFPDQFAKLQRALDAARMIVLTHFHADHVAGVTRAAEF